MGKSAGAALGVIAGAALIYFSGGVGSFLIGEMGIAVTEAGALMTFGAIELAGVMLIGNALAKNIGDTSIDNQGQILQTRKTNTAAVPFVYGENKLAGNIIWQHTNNYSGGTTNKDYWAIIAMTDGEVNDFIELYSDDELMDDKGNGTYTLAFTHIYPHETSGDGIVISNVDFCTTQSGTIVQGSNILGALVTPTVSSNSSAAGYLIDGKSNSWWLPSSTTDEHIKFIDNISSIPTEVKVLLADIDKADEQAVFTYSVKLQYSDDDSVWNDGSADYANNAGVGSSWVTLTSTETSSHSYWRVFFTLIEKIEHGSFDGTVAPVYELDFTSDVTITASIAENISYIAVHELFDNTHMQLTNISAILQGRTIDYFDASGVAGQTYSASPPAIVYDIMKERLNISISDIDIDSFYEAQQFADTNSLNCHIVFAQQQNTDSAIQSILATMRGHIVFSNNKWVFIHDNVRTVDKALTESDVLQSSLSVSMASSSDIANKITVKYINPDDEWQIATASFTDPDIVTIDGQEVEKIVEVRGVTNRTLANKLAQLTLNQMRYSEDSSGDRINQTPLSISFSTTIKNADLETGDILSLDHFLLNYIRKFKILSVETDQSGAIQLQCLEYCDTHYENADGTSIFI